MDLGHLRQRQVLAALLVEANLPVSVERLIDRLWGERPPQRAATTLYSYVSRLRRVIEPLGASISRHPHGYVCEVDPQAVDLHRFRDLVARAHSAGDDTHAARLLTEALRLWPGEAPAEPDTPWFNALRGTLEGERLAAELDLNDLLLCERLAVGIHRVVVHGSPSGRVQDSGTSGRSSAHRTARRPDTDLVSAPSGGARPRGRMAPLAGWGGRAWYCRTSEFQAPWAPCRPVMSETGLSNRRAALSRAALTGRESLPDAIPGKPWNDVRYVTSVSLEGS